MPLILYVTIDLTCYLLQMLQGMKCTNHIQMLPFGGQGSNQAIEDAGALGCVLKGLESPEEVSARLEVFEKVRIKRASMIQTLSKVRVGKENEVEREIRQYVPPGSKVPGTFAERSAHAFRSVIGLIPSPRE